MRSIAPFLLRIALALLSLLLFAIPRTADAQPPTADLLARLAVHAAQYERMKTHACYRLDGRMENVDKAGKTESVKEMLARIDADGSDANLIVLKYLEDGEDKTEEAQTKARKHNAAPKAEREKESLRMPFLVSEQSNYTFDQVEIDKLDASRVRVTFVPKTPGDHALEGSAWVDTRLGTVISAGFKLSKTSFFVDYVHITLEFAAATTLGPAISRVTLDGQGGVLFFRKHFRAVAALTEYRIVP